MKVREIMTAEVVTAAPDTTLEEIATIMKRDDVGSVPILEDGELCGLVTDRDIVVRCIAEGQHPGDSRAEDILTEDLHTIEADEDVEAAAELMGLHQIRRLPVVDKGRLVGMVAIGDIAVKQGNDRRSGDTLEDISQGVKDQRQRENRTDRKASASERKASRPHRQERASTASTVRGRQSDDRKQGITNHSAGEEKSRNNRVISIRNTGSAERKSSDRKKAG